MNIFISLLTIRHKKKGAIFFPALKMALTTYCQDAFQCINQYKLW